MHTHFWAHRRAMHKFQVLGGCFKREGCGPESRHWGESDDEGFFGGGGGGFGIRRPLRFLAHQLELDEGQIATLARVLDELKTERAQGEVDRRRSVAAFADALASDVFDTAKATAGGELRGKSATRLCEAIVKALQQLHAILKPEQRTRLAYLIRAGRLAI
jgi:Spy/CpxP family protein refolding chaperone